MKNCKTEKYQSNDNVRGKIQGLPHAHFNLLFFDDKYDLTITNNSLFASLFIRLVSQVQLKTPILGAPTSGSCR